MIEFTPDDAIKIAVDAHKGGTDLSGNRYIMHPLKVMIDIHDNYHGVQSLDDLMVVAALHDVVEDTEWTLDGLFNIGASRKQIDAIDALTRRDGETYADFILRCTKNELARIVKFYDCKDNLRPRRIDNLDPEKKASLRRRYVRAMEILEPRTEVA